jgi:hypothetical protein
MRLIALTLALCLPAAAAPADGLRALCEESAAMAAEASELRRAEAGEAEAAAEIAAGTEAPALAALAPQIAAWVWTLPADALAPEEIRAAFVAQCLEQGAAME